MTKTSDSWEDVGESILRLQRMGIPIHEGSPQKNWDLVQICDAFRGLEDRPIVDLGCGGFYVLEMLRSLGFRDLTGIDLDFGLKYRLFLMQKTFLRHGHFLPDYKVMKRDILRTRFKDNSFEGGVCMSVIEHGIDIDSFFEEASRIMKNGSTLYLSTDYWEPKLDTNGVLLSGPWKIFSRDEIASVLDKALQYGFSAADRKIPNVEKPIVHLLGKDYTFLSMLFRLEK